jgi:hypothetical protein
VAPGNLEELEAEVSELLADGSQAASLGARARETVERSLTWSRYVDTMSGLLSAAAGSVGSP